MTRHPLLKSARRRGFTLIELLVALGISMLIVIVIAEVFLQTRRSYQVQDDQARVQENTRFIVQNISRVVRQAGYRSYAGLASTAYFSSATNLPAITGTDGTNSAPDSLTVNFQGSGDGTGTGTADPDNTIFDCLGNAKKYGTNASSTFTIASGSDGNGLFCASDSAATAVEIVPGVENMQVLYGVDTDGDRTANYYARITDITGNNLDKIVGARIALLVRSPTETSAVANNNTFVLNGLTVGSTTASPPAAFTDRRVRRVVEFTVNMRNRTP